MSDCGPRSPGSITSRALVISIFHLRKFLNLHKIYISAQRGDNYLTAVYSVSSRDSVDSGHTYIDHYDSIYDELDALEDYNYLTPAIGALRVQHP